ncbi:hypothetical protein EC100833_3081, partial [Escherichia coli 10.0833]
TYPVSRYPEAHNMKKASSCLLMALTPRYSIMTDSG